MRVLDAIKPFVSFLPEVEAPLRRESFNERLSWSAYCLILYLFSCNIPIYGAVQYEGNDSLSWLRVVLASNKGTLMELGLSPLITSGMIMYFLVGARLIDINMRSKEDRELYQSAIKVLTVFIAFV